MCMYPHAQPRCPHPSEAPAASIRQLHIAYHERRGGGWCFGADGKPVPTELRKEAHALRQQIDLEDTRTAQVSTHIDDEYARATEADPKVLLTTSREPSSRLSQFAKVSQLPHPALSPVSFLCLWRGKNEPWRPKHVSIQAQHSVHQ